MSEEVVSTPASTTEEATPQTPTEFRDYVKWRKTGELPAVEEPPSPAPAAAEPETTEPPATTEPQSGAEDTQQPAEEEDDQAEVQSQPIGKRGAQRQRRIDRLTAEIDLLKAQLAAAHQPAKPATEPKQAPPPGKPVLENFETLEAYQEALTDWKLDQREAQRAAQSAEQKLQTEWSKSEKASRAAHADYDDVVQSVKAPEGPGVIAARQAMLEDEAGAEILYHLAKHPDELRRIAALNPVSAVREIGKLAATLTPSSTANGNGKPKVSAAPKPPPELSRPGKTASDSIHDPAVLNDFRRYAKARAAMKDK